MAAKLVRGTDPIVVEHIGAVLYGEPGLRKSSCAQTATQPFTFAFDPGIYRAFGRKDAAMFETWNDVIEVCRGADNGATDEMSAAIRNAKTLVLDTLGMGMHSLAAALILENPKNGNKLGGLSLQGYGQLGNRFADWIGSRLNRKQDVVMICHEDSEKRGDETYRYPAIVGAKFYNELMRFADLVGYLHFEGGKRVLDFNPSDRYMAKTPPCNWGRIELPDFATAPEFLGNLLAEAKASMGRVSESSAKVQGEVEIFKAWLAKELALDDFNNGIKDLSQISKAAKPQAWQLICAYADARGWRFDKDAKVFKVKEVQAA